jgi:hypothetical protein
MSIIRIKKDTDYFVASNEPFNNRVLSWEARGMLAFLLSKPDDWEVYTKNLINESGAGKHKVQRIINELKKAGYMRRYRASDDKGRKFWVTEVYERLDMNPKRPKPDDPISRPSENPATGKPGDILNTDLPNTKSKESPAKRGAGKNPPKEPKPETPHQALMRMYQEALGYKIPNGAKEGKAAKTILQTYTPEQAIGCYNYLKSQRFWKTKFLSLVTVNTSLGEWVKNGEPSSANGIDKTAVLKRLGAFTQNRNNYRMVSQNFTDLERRIVKDLGWNNLCDMTPDSMRFKVLAHIKEITGG